MRFVETFTDGRIHITLIDGAYDLQTLTPKEREIYKDALDAYRADVSVHQFAVPTSPSNEALDALCKDLFTRLVLEAYGGEDDEEGELLPWQPERVKQTVDRAMNRYAMAG